MDAILQQFFNLDIMYQAAPLILRGLGMTVLVCLAVVPLGLAGGLLVALAAFVAIVALQVRLIINTKHPRLRAIELCENRQHRDSDRAVPPGL